MISMYAEYSGRTLYVALSSDTIEGAKNGDKLYQMDTGKQFVYNESNNSWDEQPEEGGGGDDGGLKLLGSGTYTKASTSSSINIPVNYTGTPKLFYVYVPEPVADTGQTVFGARWVDLENSETDSYTHNGAGFGMYTTRNQSNAIVWANPTNLAWPGITATNIILGRTASYANYLANTYKWFIYG